MQVHLPADIEAQFTQLALARGDNPDALASEVLAAYLRDQARFVEAVKAGEASLARGDFITQEALEKQVERWMKP